MSREIVIQTETLVSSRIFSQSEVCNKHSYSVGNNIGLFNMISSRHTPNLVWWPIFHAKYSQTPSLLQMTMTMTMTMNYGILSKTGRKTS